MRYLSYFTSADGPGPNATWTVYSELYEEPDSDVPIDGSENVVATGLPGFEEAERMLGALSSAGHPRLMKMTLIIQEESDFGD